MLCFVLQLLPSRSPWMDLWSLTKAGCLHPGLHGAGTPRQAFPALPLCLCPPAPPPWRVRHLVSPRVPLAPAHPVPGANAGCGEQGWGCAGANPPPAPGQCCWGLHSLTPGRRHHLSSGLYRNKSPDAPFCGLFGHGAEAPRGGESRGSYKDRVPTPLPARTRFFARGTEPRGLGQAGCQGTEHSRSMEAPG